MLLILFLRLVITPIYNGHYDKKGKHLPMIHSVRFIMSHTYNIEQGSSHLNLIDNSRRIPSLKVFFKICQCCSRGTMVWTEHDEHSEEFWCDDCIYIQIFDTKYFFM